MGRTQNDMLCLVWDSLWHPLYFAESLRKMSSCSKPFSGNKFTYRAGNYHIHQQLSLCSYGFPVRVETPRTLPCSFIFVDAPKIIYRKLWKLVY